MSCTIKLRKYEKQSNLVNLFTSKMYLLRRREIENNKYLLPLLKHFAIIEKRLKDYFEVEELKGEMRSSAGLTFFLKTSIILT